PSTSSGARQSTSANICWALSRTTPTWINFSAKCRRPGKRAPETPETNEKTFHRRNFRRAGAGAERQSAGEPGTNRGVDRWRAIGGNDHVFVAVGARPEDLRSRRADR